MSIVTKSGDKGETSLCGGQRVAKDHPRVCAYGAVDELNAALGVVLAYIQEKPDTNDNLKQMAGILLRIQSELFALGSELSTPSVTAKTPFSKRTTRLAEQKNYSKDTKIEQKHIDALEQEITKLENTLPPLAYFILPSGGIIASHLHLARTICRRAERSVTTLHRAGEVKNEPLIYLNRLSDLLFLLARDAASKTGEKEIRW